VSSIIRPGRRTIDHPKDSHAQWAVAHAENGRVATFDELPESIRQHGRRGRWFAGLSVELIQQVRRRVEIQGTGDMGSEGIAQRMRS
jgi:hypothetical protein